MNSPLRLLYCIPTLAHGGTQRRLAFLASELGRRGHDVHVAVLGRGPNVLSLHLEPDRVHALRSSGNHDPWILTRLWRLARRLRPDLLHTWVAQMDIFGGVAARMAGRPFVVGEPSSEAAYPRTWKNLLREHVARGAEAIIANSEGGAAFWRSRLPGKPCFVVRNGLPLAEIEATPPADLAAWGLAGERVVLYVGRFDPAKNLENLVRGLERACADSGVRALLCGDGPLRPVIQGLVDSAGLGSRVEVAGPVATAWGLMKNAAVFISVSHFEGQPNAVLEAMACGAPLVVSDIPAHREFLDDTCAVFVDPDDPVAIAAGVRRALCDPTSAARRAAEARHRTQPLSIPAMVDGYEQVYREVLSATARGSNAARADS